MFYYLCDVCITQFFCYYIFMRFAWHCKKLRETTCGSNAGMIRVTQNQRLTVNPLQVHFCIRLAHLR